MNLWTALENVEKDCKTVCCKKMLKEFWQQCTIYTNLQISKANTVFSD